MEQLTKTVKPHIPMIKFKKGGSVRGHGDVQASVSSKPVATAAPKGAFAAQQRPLIEDWQLPLRLRRQILDEKEIDAINSGGAY